MFALPRAGRVRAAAALAAIPFALLLGITEHATAGENHIAVVDVQRVVMSTEEGMRAQATLKKRLDKRQKELEGKQTELQHAREDIERQARVVSREAAQRRMEDWQKQMVELQVVFGEYNKELQKLQADLTGPIFKKLFGIIARLAKKNGYEMVLDKTAVPYVRPDLDLTDQVVQMYNSGDVGEAAAEEPKPAGK